MRGSPPADAQVSLRDWLHRQIGEVPPDDAVCEFRCRRLQCLHGEWERCDRRLRGGLPADLPDAGEGPGTPSADASS
jgi:hypothetical protein